MSYQVTNFYKLIRQNQKSILPKVKKNSIINLKFPNILLIEMFTMIKITKTTSIKKERATKNSSDQMI